MTTNNSITESNISLYTKDNNRKTISGYFPLLKFKENLYYSCQTKFSKFLNKSNDIKLLINNKVNEKISLNDYIINSYNNLNENKLTPIPYINKRKLKNNLERNELKNFQRNVVFMRRLEYTNKMKEKKIKYKYKNHITKIIVLQKVIRGYLVRKVIYQINIIKETLANFFYSIRFCIIKKYYYIFNKKLLFYGGEDNKEKNSANCDMNIYNEKTTKNSKNNDFEYKNENDNKIKINKEIEQSKDLCYVEFDVIKNKKKETIDTSNFNPDKFNSNKYNKYILDLNKKYNFSPKKSKEKHESIIENDDYIEFSSKKSNKNFALNQKKNLRNKNSRNDLNYQLSSLSSINNLKRTKTQTIQRQFRKYLSNKGYYGKFDKRKIAIIYLIKYMAINSIKNYILNIFKSFYRESTEIQSTQEENYYNMPSERIDILNRKYLEAINEIN